MLNPDYGDITDPHSGTDLVITYGKPPGAQFPQTTITPRRKSSPLSKDTDEIARLLDSVPNFDSVFEDSRKTPEQVQTMLDEFLLSEDDAEESAAETNRYGTNSSGEVSVDDAFKELLNN